MENLKENRTLTFEEALQDPSLAHIHEGLRYLQKTPPKDIFPKKYEISMVGIALEDTITLFQKNPNMPLKMVVSTIIASFDDDLSADLIVKMTPKIIDKWKTLSVKVAAQTEVLAVS
jgi:hypothetical protein